ncbi:MAG: hypothetical protein ABIU58_08960, partial [Ramlibacter sp.]
VVKVNKILPREASADAVAKQERLQYAQWWSSAESMAYYNMLRGRFKVKIEVPEPKPDEQLIAQ